MRFVSWGGCLLVLGCSVYDASLLDPNLGPDATDPGPSSGGEGGQGGDVGAGGPGGGENAGGASAVGTGPAGVGGTSVASTTSSGGTSSGAGGTGGASSGVGGMAGAPDAGRDGASNDATPVADAGTPTGDAPCVRESSANFCLRKSANCGDVSGVDNCGAMVTIACGTCGGRTICEAGGPNRCGNAVNIVRGGTVFSSSPNVPPEDMTAAFDGKASTKWFAGDTIATGFIGYDFGAGATHIVSYYAITSANDMPGRDPAAWQFQGSNDGTSWTTLDSRAAQSFSSRLRTNSYDCATRGAYSRYRLNVTANSGSAALQLAEIQLFGY